MTRKMVSTRLPRSKFNPARANPLVALSTKRGERAITVHPFSPTHTRMNPLRKIPRRSHERVIGLTVGLFLLSFLPNMGVLPFDAFAVAASQQQPLPGLGTDEGALSLEGEFTAVDAKNR